MRDVFPKLTLVSRLTLHASFEQAEYDAEGRESFAAVERSMLDRRLLYIGRRRMIKRTYPHQLKTGKYVAGINALWFRTPFLKHRF
jgi:hypothetical protein